MKLNDLIKKFNSRVHWTIRLLVVAILAVILMDEVLLRFIFNWRIGQVETLGLTTDCRWQNVLSLFASSARFYALERQYLNKSTVKDYDDKYGIELVSFEDGDSFWIKRTGLKSGRQLLAYLKAEHEWMGQRNTGQSAKSGDVVVDCGAHVGVFTRRALNIGAKLVVAIEPDPINAECIRRNFAREIENGRLLPIELALWSHKGSFALNISDDNSGMNSLIFASSDKRISIATNKLDAVLEDAGIKRIDYLKMDIEGAEREALLGAQETIQRDRPVLMIESYQREGDLLLIPFLIARPGLNYAMTCGPCQRSDFEIVPHVTYFSTRSNRSR